MPKKKTVLILSNTSNGLYLFRRELISELLKSYHVDIVTSDTGRVEEIETMGCSVTIVPIELHGTNIIRELSLYFLFKSKIKQVKPDVVITYTVKPNVYGGIICRRLKVPYCSNITGLGSSFEGNVFLKRFVSRLYTIALKKAEIVFFENSTNMKLFINEGIVDEKSACLLSGAGVNLERFFLQPYPQNDVFRFLFIGRVMREKGMDELIAAMKRLQRDGIACELDVVGLLQEDYKDLFHSCELKGWLKYHGRQSDVRPYIKEADCLVLPSYHEGMANTNLECAASGRPIITSNIPGCREAVIKGMSGFTCEPKNVDSLYKVMKNMIGLSREEREKMGLAGRKHMESVFDKKKVVEKTVNVLNGVLA